MSYIDIIEHKGTIHAWERDVDGVLHHIEEPVEDYLYLFMTDNTGAATHKNIHGHPLRKVTFDTKRELKAFADDRKEIVFESDLNPVYRFMIERYLDTNTAAPYNLCLFDIEVQFNLADGLGYPSIQNPFGEINSISIYDSSMECYIMLIPIEMQGVVRLKDEYHGIPVETFWTRSERDMLLIFADYLEHVDIISGWNSIAFDVNYIIARATRHFGEKKAIRMFCRDNLPARKREFTNEYGEDTWEWMLAGRSHLDMMMLFKKFNPGEKKSFKLDSICEEVLGESKIEFEDDLGALFEENPQKFYEYSLHDSRLLKMLDDKTKIIDLAMMMARDMCALPKDVTGSVNIINMALMKFCRKKDNIVLPDMSDMQKEDFDGALVYDTIAGRHGLVFTIDLTALYPSAIILIGMSKENLLYQAKNGYEDYIKIMSRANEEIEVYDERMGEWFVIPADGLESMIRTNGWCISGNGTVFDGTTGILAEFTKEGFDQRKHYQNLMGQTDDKRLYEQYNLYQSVLKIRNNSIYGILSQPAFRMADIRISASTTATGRLISLWQAQMANQLVEELKET